MFHDCCTSIAPILHDVSALRMSFGVHAVRATRAHFKQAPYRLRKWTGGECTAPRRTTLLRLYVSGSDVTSQLDRTGAHQCKPRSGLPGRCQGTVFLSE